MSGRGIPIRDLNTAEAASLLGISPATLGAWEQRYGFPRSQGSPSEQRLFVYSELAAIHNELGRSMSVCAAVSRARDALATETD